MGRLIYVTLPDHSLSLRDDRAEPQGRDLAAETVGRRYILVHLRLTSVSFLIQPRTICLHMVPPIVGWTLTSNSNQGNIPIDLPTGLCDGAVPRLSLPQIILGCVKVAAEANQEK